MSSSPFRRRFSAMNGRKLVLNGLCLLIGGFIAAVAVNVFFIPIRLTMGGLSGVASIIFQLTGQGEFLSFGLLYLLLNIPVMLIGWRMISITFIWRSLVGSIFYSAMVDLLAPVLQDWFSTYINRLAGGAPDPLIYCLFWRRPLWHRLGNYFPRRFHNRRHRHSGSGHQRRRKTLSMGQFLLILDAIILASVVAYHDDGGPAVLLAMYSFIAMYLTSKASMFCWRDLILFVRRISSRIKVRPLPSGFYKKCSAGSRC